jgi:DNA polymerase III delta prime subunit
MCTEISSDEYNRILNRTEIADEIADFLLNFNQIKQDVNQKKGIYIYGSTGIGKSQFIKSLVSKIGFDPITYDAGDLRNKAFIDSIASQHMSTNNILQLFRGKPKQIVIIMDEIDGMNRNDQGGISALSKLIRQKKMKKHKRENTSAHPIICISNYGTDKKIRDLMKVCRTFELKEPTTAQMDELLTVFSTPRQLPDASPSASPDVPPPNLVPLSSPSCQPTTTSSHHPPTPATEILTPEIRHFILNYVQSDIRKLDNLCRFIFPKGKVQTAESIRHSLDVFQTKLYNDDVKDITHNLLTNSYKFDEHTTIMNDTDRTIIALLYHENIVDAMETIHPQQSFQLYLQLLENMCFSDYMYRITFQSQIWQFNEMCYLLKIMYNNYIYHKWNETNANLIQNKSNDKPSTKSETSPRLMHQMAKDIRFTKILTKYSTEYGNSVFLSFLCEETGLDKKDLFALFQEMRLFFTQSMFSTGKPTGGTKGIEFDTPYVISEMERVFQPNHNIDRLEIRRMYRFLNQLAVASDKIITEDTVHELVDDEKWNDDGSGGEEYSDDD